ncbi:MAG: hypothetical protein ACFFAY_04895 [Promethearchaeota archaeon]
MAPSSHRYIAVDKSSVMRCQWCGIVESRYWVRGKGGPWCSEECQSASTLGSNICGSLVFTGCILLIFLPVMDVVAALFGILLSVCCSGMFFGSSIRRGLHTRKIIQRGSLRIDRTLETGAFLCANCGGALEVKSGMTDVECFYCGVTNEISIG